MKSLSFSYKDTALVSKKELANAFQTLKPEIKALNLALKKGYGTDYASINLLSDKKILKDVKALIKAKLSLKPSYIVVIGIGGSNLGTIAVQEAVLGKLYNQSNSKIKILYADTVDSDSIHSISNIIKSVKGNVILNVISKSGTTTETVKNFEVLLTTLKRYRNDYRKRIVITTDFNSKLWRIAEKERYSRLAVPKKVGGRYSVFSSVSLFPLGMLGLNLNSLLFGAGDMMKKCLSLNKNTNLAALSASLLYLKHRPINDNFLFSNDLESIGKWYRQLMGESVGKERNTVGRIINTGITPTVSIGSTDLHSMAQLYLGGPFDKFTTFFSVRKTNHPLNKLDKAMDAILKGTMVAFKKGKRPYTHFILPDKSEYSIGQVLQLKMIEMMYLGYLLNVNPFDQPNVEYYKSETRKILKK